MYIDNLRSYLAQIGMKAVDFSVILDIHPTYLSQVMNGRAVPGKRLARDIYNATGGVINLKTKPLKRDLKKQQQQEQQK